MKILFTATGVLLLLPAGLASAQTAKPPVKMGLWREDVTTTITGIDGVSSSPQKYAEVACISPESWKHGLQPMNAKGCEVSNLREDSHKMSYELHCGTLKGDGSGFHVEILIDNDENMHGTAVAKFPGSTESRGGSWTSTLTEHYLAPDCGDVKPSEKKPVK